MNGLHRIARELPAGFATRDIVVAGVFNAVLVGVIAIGPRRVEPTPPVIDIDVTEVVTPPRAIATAHERPAPIHCVPVAAIRELRGHVVETVDDLVVPPYNPPGRSNGVRFETWSAHGELAPAPPASAPDLSNGARFAIRFAPGELAVFDRAWSKDRQSFGHYLHEAPMTLCEGATWIETWDYAWPHGGAKRYVTALIDSIE